MKQIMTIKLNIKDMKKQVILAFAFSVCAFTFAQKKELKTAEKAIKGNNFAEAKTVLEQTKPMLSAMDDKQKAQYYYLLGQSLYANGAGTGDDIDAAIENLKNAESVYASEVKLLKQDMINTMLKSGNAAYESKNFASSSNDFEKAYRLSPTDTTYLYYAASTAINVPDYNRALGLYEELKKLNYTGIEKQFFALNVATQEEDLFPNKNMRDISVRTKSHEKPTDKLTDSKKAEIVKNIALIYKSNGDDEKAIAALKDARKENPDDLNLLLVEADLQLKLGNRDAFKVLMEEATQKDPKNAELQFNLGVIAAESGDKEAAKNYYIKASELDPKYVNAYINLAALILGQEEILVKEMNGLGNSKKDNLRYDELKEARQELYREAVPPLIKAHEVKPNNIDAAKTLMNIYSILGETAKYKEFKAKVEALEAAN
jgi:tetratricopeptide (TPR) repeat protein